jgi:hypothetical protein
MATILFLVSDQTDKGCEAMQTKQTVARVLACCKTLMHSGRHKALEEVSRAAFYGASLSLSRLALGAQRRTALRHRIKCVDRLLGNHRLDAERIELYRALAHQWLAGLPQLLIVVDWSSLSADMQWHWLRASVVVEGRSITLYEEVHPRRHLGAYVVHQRFMARLAHVLPATRQAPIVITDAGFRNTWFRLAASHGWDWVGRVRNRDMVRRDGQDWFPGKQLYARATGRARDLGLYETVRNHPLRCRLVLLKQAAKGRKHRYPSGKVRRNSETRKASARHREPWLLSCSPRLGHLDAQAIAALYAQRMRIEQQFRDTKNEVLGMGLSCTKSTGRARLQALLLIDHVASLAKRLVGEAARAGQLELRFMSTNRKQGREISVMTLAGRVIARGDQPASLPSLRDCLHRLREQVRHAFDPVSLVL